MSDTPTARGDEGAWAKIRHRKVAQWGIVYAASGLRLTLPPSSRGAPVALQPLGSTSPCEHSATQAPQTRNGDQV
jgi:hypothetical protein